MPLQPPPGLSEPSNALTLAVWKPMPPAANLLMVEDISVFRGNFGHKRAHAWLAQERHRCAHTNVESVDLSDSPQWRKYVCSHPQAREIIHTGITHFEGRFLNVRECNAARLALPAPYGHLRFDFVAWRNDGTACRLHPGGKNDALPVWGRLQDWVTDSASTPDSMISERSGGLMMNHGRIDIVSSEETLRHLYDRLDAWIRGGGLPEELAEDLMAPGPGAWPWHRFLMGRTWGEALFYETVTSFVLVLRRSMPAIEVVTKAFPWPRYITWCGTRCRMEPIAIGS